MNKILWLVITFGCSLFCAVANASVASTLPVVGAATYAQFTMDQCSVTFSPNGGTTKALVDYINSANKSIRLLAYNFTSKDVGNALIAAHNRGVDVQLVLDRSVPTEKNSILPLMQIAGIIYRIDHTHAIAHNKVILIDDEWIETGSFNYSDNAESRNGENALICHSPDAYRLYRADWEKHWAHSIDH